VGSTGSTAGDAKALKSADIGISLKGSPAVTKDAADMLLLKKEEPLQTLLNAVKLGTQQPKSLRHSYISPLVKAQKPKERRGFLCLKCW